MTLGQNAPVSALVGFADKLNAQGARIADLERLTSRIVLVSPNGTAYLIVVDNAGNLSTTPA